MIKLIELFQKNDGDVDDVVALIRREPVLGADVLRRCNQFLIGDEPPVADITEAVFRLGFYDVYRIAVALHSLQMMEMGSQLPGFPVEALRRHASIAAIAGSLLAREIGEPGALAFTAGLLHDIGKLVFAVAEGPRYVALMEECRNQGTALSTVEKATFGFHHSEIGARLLGRWGVPDEVGVAVLGRNHPAWLVQYEPLAAVTHLASMLANQIDPPQNPAVPFGDLPGVRAKAEYLRLDAEKIARWEEAVRKELSTLPTLTGAA